MLVQLIRVSDTRSVEGFGSADKTPKRATVDLSNNVIGDTIATRVPPSWDLTSDSSAELECLWDVNTGTLLELEEPLATFTSPNVTLVSVLDLEFLSLSFRDFNWFQVMNKFNFLVEDLLVRVISTEELWFYESNISG